MGSGTTLVEAKLLNRNAVGIDINPQSILISQTNLQFQCETKSKIFIRKGNATDLHFMKDEHIDFICTHPPYANIIKYTDTPTAKARWVLMYIHFQTYSKAYKTNEFP